MIEQVSPPPQRIRQRRRRRRRSTVHPTIQRLTWLLAADEPWTSYRTCIDLLHSSEQSPEVKRVRQEMLAHPLVHGLIERVGQWRDVSFARFNHLPLHILSGR